MDERPTGWYRDPDDARQHRYWDGHAWIAAQADRTEVVEVIEQQ
jgi:Protein of unknown function (DUF2510)